MSWTCPECGADNANLEPSCAICIARRKKPTMMDALMHEVSAIWNLYGALNPENLHPVKAMDMGEILDAVANSSPERCVVLDSVMDPDAAEAIINYPIGHLPGYPIEQARSDLRNACFDLPSDGFGRRERSFMGLRRWRRPSRCTHCEWSLTDVRARLNETGIPGPPEYVCPNCEYVMIGTPVMGHMEDQRADATECQHDPPCCGRDCPACSLHRDTHPERFVSWRDVDHQVNRLADALQKIPAWRKLTVVAVARGGLIPATMLTHKVIMNPSIMTVQLVRQQNEPMGRAFTASIVNMTEELNQLDENEILFVDDIYDTGATYRCLKDLWPGAHFMCLNVKGDAIPTDVIWAEKYPNVNQWIEFPWER